MSVRNQDYLQKINILLQGKDVKSLSSLEFDLVMDHLRKLYDTLIIEREPERASDDDAQRKANVSADILIQPEELLAPYVQEMPAVLFGSGEKKEKQDNVLPPDNEELTQAGKTDFVAAEEKEQDAAPDRKKSGTINDLRTPEVSLNEKLKAPRTELHQRMAIRPLRDLMDLNKRFVLVNELFGGRQSAFNDAVSELDALTDYSEAEKFISERLSTPYQWDHATQTVRLFMKLVRQKFGEE